MQKSCFSNVLMVYQTSVSCCLISSILLTCNPYHYAVWLHKYCNVIIWVHLWDAVVIAVEEMKLCTATSNCVACTMHWLLYGMFDNSILLSYRDILLTMDCGSAVISDNLNVFPCLFAKQYTTFEWKRAISGVHSSAGGIQPLVIGDGKINHVVIAYTLSCNSAKNYHNRLMDMTFTACQVSVIFFWDQCI